MTTMKTTSAQIAVALGKVCGMVQVAKRAKELVVIQSNTGIVIMTKEREALTLALEALELIAFFKLQPDSIQSFVNHYTPRIKETLKKIKPNYNETSDLRLMKMPAQPEQEPSIAACIIGSNAVGGVIDGYQAAIVYKAMIKAAERKEPEQEPVAWEAPQGHGIKRFISQSLYEKFSPEIRKWYKPYKCPSCEADLTQRTWIDLTDEEIFNALGISGSSDADYNAVRTLSDGRKLEAKLKEKNT